MIALARLHFKLYHKLGNFSCICQLKNPYDCEKS